MDMFEFDEKTENNGMTFLGRYCLKLYNLTEVFNIPDIKAGYFFNELQHNYKSNPYHNSIHGTDVLISSLYIISNSEISSHLSSLEMLLVIISHMAHDVGHPGHTNRYLINTQDPLAIKCNFLFR